MVGEESSAMRTTIGERVRTYRLRRGLTQARLAHLIGRHMRFQFGPEFGRPVLTTTLTTTPHFHAYPGSRGLASRVATATTHIALA
jgi:transcriptional regulator with XRE-family HTH domain